MGGGGGVVTSVCVYDVPDLSHVFGYRLDNAVYCLCTGVTN